MPAPLFLLLGVVLLTVVVSAWRSGEITGKGWGFKMCVYGRDSDPFLYWVNFVSYLVLALWAIVFGVMEISRRT